MKRRAVKRYNGAINVTVFMKEVMRARNCVDDLSRKILKSCDSFCLAEQCWTPLLHYEGCWLPTDSVLLIIPRKNHHRPRMTLSWHMLHVAGVRRSGLSHLSSKKFSSLRRIWW